MAAFVRQLEDETGIALDQSKRYLLDSRLATLARDQGFESVEALITRLAAEPVGAVHREAFEALTTNETSFFRDTHCFEGLARSLLPDLIRRRRAERSIRVWSAATATGQEAYSLAMLLAEQLPAPESWRIQITATDLSKRVLDKAADAHYLAHETSRGLDPARLARHFVPTDRGWQVRPALRSMVHFQPLNLVDAWPPLPRFDLVMLRNVLIYFSPATRDRVLARVHRVLEPGGVLVLGAAEMIAPGGRFELVRLERSSFYRPLAEKVVQ